jgi:hypothetical protein
MCDDYTAIGLYNVFMNKKNEITIKTFLNGSNDNEKMMHIRNNTKNAFKKMYEVMLYCDEFSPMFEKFVKKINAFIECA